MRNYLTIGALLLVLTATGLAQTKRTEETKTESQTNVDSTSGKVTTVSTVTSVASTEDITPRTHMISSDPIKFWQFYNISYYRAISPQIVVGGGIQLPTALGDREMTGFGVNLEARFYLSGKPFRGFHLNPVFTFNSISYESYMWDSQGPTNAKIKDTPASIGLLMGWHWYPWEEFGTQIAFGADYNISGTSESGILGLASEKVGVVPSARFTVGYSW
jgi:hypothetical protein